mmetsp:Transcript_16927/g.52925  ORF Transcript_16927/g.52925 Transcript_16927/m.52925 type:complete len:204 (-) Transcript_16927:632-1243(-)
MATTCPPTRVPLGPLRGTPPPPRLSSKSRRFPSSLPSAFAPSLTRTLPLPTSSLRLFPTPSFLPRVPPFATSRHPTACSLAACRRRPAAVLSKRWPRCTPSGCLRSVSSRRACGPPNCPSSRATPCWRSVCPRSTLCRPSARRLALTLPKCPTSWARTAASGPSSSMRPLALVAPALARTYSASSTSRGPLNCTRSPTTGRVS